ncbi:hypothetical protein L596_023351 [Steinernema carpocapsae]|uniref:Uncharacterized protein n=1 Tax=Steinernema carpocapsae TaxID=34508 RepID=A0A4U5MDF0_STECR|nr:hypothetical protein L596_023351 [Steinernema carpocapsae]
MQTVVESTLNCGVKDTSHKLSEIAQFLSLAALLLWLQPFSTSKTLITPFPKHSSLKVNETHLVRILTTPAFTPRHLPEKNSPAKCKSL